MKFGVQRTGTPVRFTEDFYNLTLLGFISGVTCIIAAYVVVVLNRNFLTVACDTEVLENAIVNTIHGHWFATNGAGGPNLLSAHTTFMLLAVIPFYIVLPFPETLFVLQCVGVYSTVFPLYLVARDFGLQPRIAYFIAAMSLISAFLLHMAMAPFHFEGWIAAAALWSYHFYLRNNLPGFVISILAALSCAEQASLIFISLGLSLLLVRDDCSWRRRFGMISVLFGGFWLVLAIGVISPLAQTSSFNIYAYNYTQWGIKSAAGLPGAVLHDPGKALQLFFAPARWLHLLSVVGLLLVTACCSWRSLLLLLPLPAYLLMSDQEFTLYFHAYYYSFIFFAGYIGLFHLLRRFEPDGKGVMAVFSVFTFAAVLTLCLAASYYTELITAVDEPFSAMLREEFAKIPPEATVYGPHRYSIYLGNRVNFLMGDMPPANTPFDDMVNRQFDKYNVHARQIDYIVSDYWTDQCGWRRGFMNPPDLQRRQDAVSRLVASGQWEIAWQVNDAVILQRVK